MAAGKPNIAKLYDKLFTIKEMLSEVVNTAMEAANDAESFGGEVARVITSQLRQDLIPAAQKYIDDANTPASAAAMIQFLDSVPLAWIRIGPENDPRAAASGSAMMGQGVDTATQPSAVPTVPNATSNAIANEVANDARQQQQQESAVLQGRKNELRESLRSSWEEEHSYVREDGKLDFQALAESYRREPSVLPGLTPDQLTGALTREDRVFSKVLEEARTSDELDLGRIMESKVRGEIQMDENADMGSWKNLVNDDSGLEEALAMAKGQLNA